MSTEKNLKNIINLMQRDDSVDAPTDSVRWASNLFRTRAAEPKASLIQKLVAVFQMEIAPNRPAFGERSASASATRQVLYRAGDSAIDIRIEAAKTRFTVRGQILGDELAGASIRLFDDSRTFEATATETSEFRFEGVPAGTYELTIRGTKIEITLKGIEVK